MKLKRWLIILTVTGSLAGLGIFAFTYAVINHAPKLIPAALLQLAREPDLLKYPEAKRCSDCHRTIFEAWKKSRHSVAWVSEGYVKASENHTKEKCLPCHVPTTVFPGEKPDPRLNHRDDGIYCVPCHVKNDAMNGPYSLLSPPHPTKQNDDYRSAKFCSTCHQKTFKEWKATQSEKTCQSCHMMRKPGRLTQKFPLSLFHQKREVADHSFPKRTFEDVELEVTAEIRGGFLDIHLTNKNIPHLLPTADNGDPRLYLYVHYYDNAGEEIDDYKEILAPQQDTALPFNKTVSFRYDAEEDLKRAEIFVRYKPAWSKEKTDVHRLEVVR